jgi:hypothetical protein
MSCLVHSVHGSVLSNVTLLLLLKRKWKAEVTEVYTRTIFSAANITLNMN